MAAVKAEWAVTLRHVCTLETTSIMNNFLDKYIAKIVMEFLYSIRYIDMTYMVESQIQITGTTKCFASQSSI